MKASLELIYGFFTDDIPGNWEHSPVYGRVCSDHGILVICCNQNGSAPYVVGIRDSHKPDGYFFNKWESHSDILERSPDPEWNKNLKAFCKGTGIPFDAESCCWMVGAVAYGTSADHDDG